MKSSASKKVYVPKHSYLNKTSGYIEDHVSSVGLSVIRGNTKMALKSRSWEQADLVIPPTHITKDTFSDRMRDIYPIALSEKFFEALSFSEKLHSGQVRLNLNDYFTGHILPCTLYLALVQVKTRDVLNEDMLVAMLLHDAVEDSEVTFKQLSKQFGPKVGFYVQRLTKRAKNSYEGDETYVKLTSAEKKSVRNSDYSKQINKGPYEVLVLKCVDRILNITDDIQNVVENNNTKRVQGYIDESKTYYTSIFEQVAKTNPYYLEVFKFLTRMLE